MNRRVFLKLVSVTAIVPCFPRYSHFDSTKEYGNCLPVCRNMPHADSFSVRLERGMDILYKDMKKTIPPEYREKVVFGIKRIERLEAYRLFWKYAHA